MALIEEDDALDTRTVQQEEEEQAQPTAAEASELLPCLWNQGVRQALFPSGIIVRTMVVATHKAACALLNYCAPNKQVLGTILLPEADVRGNHALPAPPASSDKNCVIYAVPASTQGSAADLIVSCQFPVTAERAVAVCRSLMAEVCPEELLILGSTPADTYRCPGDPTQEPLLYAACALQSESTTGPAGGAKAAQWPAGAVRSLPSGVVVSGLPAALLSYCQVRHMRSTLFLSIEGGPQFRLSELARLASALSQAPQAANWQLNTALEGARKELAAELGHSATHM